jgi:plasmid stabilization system protein ParE
MAEITWTAEAQRWLKDIYLYIAQDNPEAAASELLLPSLPNRNRWAEAT